MLESSLPDHTQTQACISVCIVVYKPDRKELRQTLESLASAITVSGDLDVSVTIVDNSPTGDLSSWLTENFASLRVNLIAGQGNIGFGRANNRVLPDLGDFHLVLNPDVVMSADALGAAVDFMQTHRNCVLLTPLAHFPDGRRQYLCKRFPTVFNLVLRGFAPGFVRKLFRARLDHYEMREMPQHLIRWNPQIVSGCFMFFRSDAFKRLGGFDPRYFLYFEDFDLSLRARSEGDIAYVPAVSIIHGGGHASRKGLWHIYQFCKSAFSFYRIWGLRLL